MASEDVNLHTVLPAMLARLEPIRELPLITEEIPNYYTVGLGANWR